MVSNEQQQLQQQQYRAQYSSHTIDNGVSAAPTDDGDIRISRISNV